MSVLKVGIIGFGTVGAGVAGCLINNKALIEGRTGIGVVLHKVADLDITTDRGITLPEGILTTDAQEVIDQCDIVVELIGGTTISKQLITKALTLGKCVVTANKALLAEHGAELFRIARENNAAIYYEASVAGGIPIIKSLREGFAGNRIRRIYGILNGTCNYILTRMERENLGFQPVLEDAQRLGYAEANPSLDIDGFDTAHKATILAALACGKWFGMAPVYVEGLRGISLTELRHAEQLGYKIKLLAIIKERPEDGNVEIRVHPTLIPKNKLLAGINEVFNGVMVNGDYVGDALFYGRGAGREATASAVVSDIIDVAVNLFNKTPARLESFREWNHHVGTVPMDDVVSRYYLRIEVEDKPGVLGHIATTLSSFGISVASLVQSEPSVNDEPVSIIILSHKAREKNVRDAIAKIESFPEVQSKVNLIRIEDL